MHSIEVIYKEHSKMVYRYLLSLTGDSDLAEELTQETFFQAVKGFIGLTEAVRYPPGCVPLPKIN